MFGFGKTEKYSPKWFTTVSDDELNRERELVQQAFCSVRGDYKAGVRLQNLLYQFDNELRKRERKDTDTGDYIYPPKREHGWNLYKPDD